MRTVLLIFLFASQAMAQLTTTGAGRLPGGGTPPTLISSAFTATDGTGTAFNTSTIPINVTGANTLLVSRWQSEFGDVSSYSMFFTYNGVFGRQFFDTDGYSGGAGNRLFRCAYWVAPTAGTHNLITTIGAHGTPIGNANELAVVALLFNGVAQTYYPFRGTQKDISAVNRTSETETVTAGASDLVVHVIASSLAVTGTPGGGETVVVTANTGGLNDASLLVTKKAGASPNVTVSSSGWANSFPLQGLAFSVEPAGTAETLTTYTDSFNRGNETPLSNGGVWVKPVGTSVFTINVAAATAVGATANENIENVSTPSFNADQRSQGTISGAGGFLRLWVRVTNAGGYMLTFADPSDIQIYKVDNDGTTLTYTQQGALIGTAFNFINGDHLELDVQGTTISAYFEGQLITSRTEGTYLTGQPGIGSFGAVNIATGYEATTFPVRN